MPGGLALSLEAEALQCDSHLPGNDSVILHSQPGLQAGKPGAEAQAPLQLQLAVCPFRVLLVLLITVPSFGSGSQTPVDLHSCM